MTNEILQLLIVNSSLFFCLVGPFLPAAWCLSAKKSWPEVCLISMILGCSSQAMAGHFWSSLVGRSPHHELWAFGGIWLIVTVITVFWYKQTSTSTPTNLHTPKSGEGCTSSHWQLLLILLAGATVRGIHPVQVLYLGQSDAYTHLNYLHNIVDSAKLLNPVYPSGYHWLLACPSLLFSIEPYNIARFAGIFFGFGMILGIYVLLDRVMNREAAIFGSFCCACFPLMTLLMKTTVGAFANQCGLMFLPSIFIFYHSVIFCRKGRGGAGGLLCLTLLGLVVTVPMMLFHVLLIISLERMIALVRFSKDWWLTSTRVALLLIPPLVLLMFNITQLAPGHRQETANILVAYTEEKKQVTEQVVSKTKSITAKFERTKLDSVNYFIENSPYFKLFVDYISLKRLNGFGNTTINWIAVVLGGLFVVFIIYGLVSMKCAFMLLGLWGAVTLMQASTGVFQFSAYQREGWSLLIATSCLSGTIAAIFYRFLRKLLVGRFLVLGCMLGSFCWVISNPPGHSAIRSSAEGEVVKITRFLGSGKHVVGSTCDDRNNPYQQLACKLDLELSTAIVSRRFTGWGNQGEIVRNVLQRDSGIQVVEVSVDQKATPFKTGRQYIVLIDEEYFITGAQKTGAFAMVTPKMVESTLKNQKQLFKANKTILRYIEDLNRKEWFVTKSSVSEKLSLYILTPV